MISAKAGFIQWAFLSNVTSMQRILLFSAAVLLFASAASADDAEELFKRKVRPLFERKCFDCHSSKADEVKSNLKLDTLEDILKGGDNGPAVEPGNAEGSFLLKAVRYEVEDYQMPPSGRLSDAEIKVVEEWVKKLKAE